MESKASEHIKWILDMIELEFGTELTKITQSIFGSQYPGVVRCFGPCLFDDKGPIAKDGKPIMLSDEERQPFDQAYEELRNRMIQKHGSFAMNIDY